MHSIGGNTPFGFQMQYVLFAQYNLYKYIKRYVSIGKIFIHLEKYLFLFSPYWIFLPVGDQFHLNFRLRKKFANYWQNAQQNIARLHYLYHHLVKTSMQTTNLNSGASIYKAWLYNFFFYYLDSTHQVTPIFNFIIIYVKTSQLKRCRSSNDGNNKWRLCCFFASISAFLSICVK